MYTNKIVKFTIIHVRGLASVLKKQKQFKMIAKKKTKPSFI